MANGEPSEEWRRVHGKNKKEVILKLAIYLALTANFCPMFHSFSMFHCPLLFCYEG